MLSHWKKFTKRKISTL